ncbi:MAG TPA: 5-formyltetrahydrofolate cyclo-ligase [Anaeromyxobacteraceae bacterium]|nr:5-formyltetrahydrofolate cyclo-ligase [Anaeromyxobacteraceae bacterium]
MEKTSKAALRAERLAARARLGPEERAERSGRIALRVDALLAERAARIVATFAPLGAEVDGLLAVEAARARGATIVFPLVREGERLLVFAPCEPAALVKGPVGALQPGAECAPVAPAAIDAVLVPGVAFSEDGHRLGRGGGYYDAALAALPRAFRVGLAFDVQVVATLPLEPHDAGLDALVTESRTLRFARESG